MFVWTWHLLFPHAGCPNSWRLLWPFWPELPSQPRLRTRAAAITSPLATSSRRANLRTRRTPNPVISSNFRHRILSGPRSTAPVQARAVPRDPPSFPRPPRRPRRRPWSGGCSFERRFLPRPPASCRARKATRLSVPSAALLLRNAPLAFSILLPSNRPDRYRLFAPSFCALRPTTAGCYSARRPSSALA
jgi:hypothetical protein